jgi:hypothetical protein
MEWRKILKERGITILNFIGIMINTAAESAESYARGVGIITF